MKSHFERAARPQARQSAAARGASHDAGDSPRDTARDVAQRKRIDDAFGAATQRVGEEEELQMKRGEAAQRQVEEEELLQGRFEPAQRLEELEEEEPLQGRFELEQRKGAEDEELQMKAVPAARAQLEAESQPPPNRTGLPDALKTGVESLSGMAMDHVQVHYNSALPARLNARAYAQGGDIHLAPGQERHLPHEAWHVVQQARGRVQPTMQMNDGVPVNDDQELEHEADVMGAHAAAGAASDSRQDARSDPMRQDGGVMQAKPLNPDKLNVAGETHEESKPLRAKERQYAEEKTGGIYRTEGEFKVASSIVATERFGDPMLLRVEMLLAIQKEKVLSQLLEPFAAGKVPAKLGGLGDPAGLWAAFKGEYKKQLDEIALALRLASHEAAEQEQAGKAEATHAALVQLSNGLPTSVLADVGSTIVPELRKIIAGFASDVLGLADIRPEATVSTLRSAAMQGAAADNAARWVGRQKGVWKVGNEHVAEIAADKQGERYELLTKVEFNADFLPWLKANP